MSGLAGLLAGRRAPGVYLWEAAFDVADVRLVVEQAGAVLAHVDGWAHESKGDFLTSVGAALDLPDWYGANLDAFEECLADLGPHPVVLLWDGWGPFARNDASSFSVVLDIAADRAAYAAGAGVRFSLLLRGAGPEVGLPTLS